MSLREALMTFFGHRTDTSDPVKAEVEEREQRIVRRVAALSGKNPDEIRAELRRRMMSIESQSMRRPR